MQYTLTVPNDTAQECQSLAKRKLAGDVDGDEKMSVETRLIMKLKNSIDTGSWVT
jgi:hypothetical protein